MTDQDAVNRHSHWSHYGDLEQEDSEMTAWYRFDVAMQNNTIDIISWRHKLMMLASAYGYATADQVIASIQNNGEFEKQRDSENCYEQHDLENKTGINKESDYYQCASVSIQSIKNMLTEKSLDPGEYKAKFLDELMRSIMNELHNGWSLRVDQDTKNANDKTNYLLNPG